MDSAPGPGTLICISQVYVPDPASVGQHMADAAEAMAAQGYRVVVFTSSRGYDNPHDRYRLREDRQGVSIRRIPLASFGKDNLFARVVAQLSFLFQSLMRSLLVRRPAGLLMTTSPPMASVVAVLLQRIRRIPVVYWVMDINPDQAVAMNEVSEGSPFARLLDWANRVLLRRAEAVVTLDRFMAARLGEKADLGTRLHVIPPWPHDQHASTVEHAVNPFRDAHGLEGLFVVLYSGNHSPAHPLDTVLEAAAQLGRRSDMRFVFVGGGVGKPAVDEAIASGRIQNAVSLPYQPLDQIRFSLSAGDVHVVVIGDQMVGCVHPSKVYAAMAVQRPVVLVGPAGSHVNDLIENHGIGWRVGHGDVEKLTDLLIHLDRNRDELTLAGKRAGSAVQRHLSREHLVKEFVEVVEGAIGDPR